MEVNVDMLEQMDLMDISDQEALDVFFSASGEEGSLTSPLPALGHADTEEDGLRRNDLSLRISDPCEIKSRILSTSSNSTCDSQASNEDGSNTPVVQSDDEDVHEDSLIKLDRSYLVEFRLKGKGVDEDPKDVLSIDPNTGVIKVHRKVDYEQYSVLMLTFQARNKSNLAIDTQLGMEVKILDINDNPPVFQRRVYDVTINEAAKQGGFIVGVLAIDRDAPGTPNSTIDYKIMSVTPTTKNVEFYIQESGAISFKGCFDYEPLDFEQKAEQKLTIFVENEEPYFSCEVKERPAAGLWTIITNPPKPSSRNITITVEDANAPPFFPDPGSSFSRRSSQRRQGTYFISRSTLQSLLSQLKANFVLHVTQILLELKFYKVQQVWNSQKYNQQGQTVKNLAMSNESYLQVVSQGKHQGKTQEDNEDHRDIEVTTKTQRRPAGAWSQIRSEALTAARVPQMAQRQSLSLRKVTACVHKSEKESKKKSDNVFIESLIDSGVN
ncbi:cadherin 26 isoform X2 [Labeo rohita]|uniref:Cadherin 26 isoform X2 n=1 Tax=Labeo rohita TaxID=84645 RepID=A0A498LLH7_LABRO|nr:cadherin 26 isoform X2 [Labeo rohita]